jgi:5,5'-dehydrodivanillate O-demethylase
MAAVSPVKSTSSALAHDVKNEFGPSGPGTLAGRYLRSFWQPVLNSNELAPGKAKPIRIMNEMFTLFRGHGGAAHVVAYRCPHRSSQLSTGWVEEDTIRCLYHGWRFSGDGQCVEQPNESATLTARTKIASYPTREHLGLIWAYLGEGEPPAWPPLPDFDEEGFVETRSTVYPCNYFQTHENNFDPCHILWSHSHGITHSDYSRLDVTVQPDPTEEPYGILNNWTFGAGFNVVAIGYMPNVIRTIVPSPNGLLKGGLCPQYRDSFLIHVPVDDESHIFFRTQLVRLEGEPLERYQAAAAKLRARWAADWKPEVYYAEEIMAGRMSITDVLEHPYLATIQDMVAQSGQGRMTDRHTEKLGQTDRFMNFFRRVYAREMGALAAGQPTRRWNPSAQSPEYMAQKKAVMEAGAY